MLFGSLLVSGKGRWFEGSLVTVVLVVQWLSVGLVIERSLVRLPAGALSSQPGQLSLPSLRGGKSSTGLHGCMGLRRGVFTCVG